MRPVLLVLFGLTACSNPDQDCVPVPPDCPDDAPTVGLDGGFAVDALDVSWSYEKACEFHRSDPVYVRIPDDIVGLAVSVDAGSRQSAVGYARSDDEVLLDVSIESGKGAFYDEPWYHGYTAVSTWVRPMRPGDEPAAGCLAVVAVVQGKEAVQGGRIHFSSKRGAPGDGIDVVVGLVEGTDVLDADLEAGVARMGEVLEGAGIAVDSVEIVTVPFAGGPIIKQEGEDLDSLRAAALGGPANAMYLLVVQDFEEQDGTLGFAAGIPGPVGVQGTVASAVVLSVDAHLDADFVDFLPGLFGETAAHELGHQLGLFHTTESEGIYHDYLDDTPACDAKTRDLDGDGEVSAEECDGLGGRNVMFWTSGDFSQNEWSAGQGFVLTRSPAAL